MLLGNGQHVPHLAPQRPFDFGAGGRVTSEELTGVRRRCGQYRCDEWCFQQLLTARSKERHARRIDDVVGVEQRTVGAICCVVHRLGPEARHKPRAPREILFLGSCSIDEASTRIARGCEVEESNVSVFGQSMCCLLRQFRRQLNPGWSPRSWHAAIEQS